MLLFQQISWCSLKSISAQFATEQKRRWQWPTSILRGRCPHPGHRRPASCWQPWQAPPPPPLQCLHSIHCIHYSVQDLLLLWVMNNGIFAPVYDWIRIWCCNSRQNSAINVTLGSHSTIRSQQTTFRNSWSRRETGKINAWPKFKTYYDDQYKCYIWWAES